MTAANLDQRDTPEENRRLKNGLARETPTTEEPETITLGGMTFNRMSDEEGEALFWKNEAIIARRLGISFNPPEEPNPSQAEPNPSATSAAPS